MLVYLNPAISPQQVRKRRQGNSRVSLFRWVLVFFYFYFKILLALLLAPVRVTRASLQFVHTVIVGVIGAPSAVFSMFSRVAGLAIGGVFLKSDPLRSPGLIRDSSASTTPRSSGEWDSVWEYSDDDLQVDYRELYSQFAPTESDLSLEEKIRIYEDDDGYASSKQVSRRASMMFDSIIEEDED